MNIQHKAAKVSAAGVSALCFPVPRAISMTRATWTLTDMYVTCKKCIAILNERSARDELIAKLS